MRNSAANSPFKWNIRRIFLLLSLVAMAIPMAAKPLLEAGSQGQIRERIRERMQERREQRGQQTESELPGQRARQGGGQRGSKAPETQQIAGLNVGIWPPAQAGQAPLVIFSHGFGGCHNQSTFLMEALAESGYLVIAPDHKDNKCGQFLAGGIPEVPFRKAQSWTPSTYDDRRDDIKALAEALRRDRQWNSRIDWSRVVLAGHSLGGYTALGLAGAWPSWKMSPVKAVLALSPYCHPYVSNGALGSLRIPVLYQGGTRDFGVTPFVKRAGGCYAKTSSPASFVEFDGAGHMAFTDAVKQHHDLIILYSLNYLDKYVRGISGESPFAKNPGVTTLWTK